jgi:DNA (cytosine-5)-methyltransferase 1
VKIGSLFSGIGGLELGLERAGVGHTVWQVEREDYCRQALARHWPDAVRYEDVTTVNWAAVEPVDVVCGGFPCQPFSVAGEQKGMDDERWLWPAFAECLRVVRPRYAVLENVPALVADGAAFGRVLGDLHELGFDAEWSIVSACSVGASHRRRRVFVLAHPRGEGLQGLHDPRGRKHLQPTTRELRRLWPTEPDVARVADGFPRGVVADPIRAFGNAVVPAVGEAVGRRLMSLSRDLVAAGSGPIGPAAKDAGR